MLVNCQLDPKNQISVKYLKFNFPSKKINLKTPYNKLWQFCFTLNVLTHWGRVMHICFSKLTIIGSDNGLSPGRRQAIIWTNAGILLIEPLGTNFNEILIEIHTFSLKKMQLNMSSAKWPPFCLGPNVWTDMHLQGNTGPWIIHANLSLSLVHEYHS